MQVHMHTIAVVYSVKELDKSVYHCADCRDIETYYILQGFLRLFIPCDDGQVGSQQL